MKSFASQKATYSVDLTITYWESEMWCWFGDPLTHSSTHHNLSLVKVAQIHTLANVSRFQHIDYENQPLERCHCNQCTLFRML